MDFVFKPEAGELHADKVDDSRQILTLDGQVDVRRQARRDWFYSVHV
ncbi:MAG: hypothetical protein JWO19_4706 [Bryobacterales bacterium]|nr:hypothetical protein [Bryobacterales bacterium]